jgi:hypothetical protein
VKRDKLKRTAVCANSSSEPIAERIGFAAKSSLAQALPVLAAIPFLFRSQSSDSPSTPHILKGF